MHTITRRPRAEAVFAMLLATFVVETALAQQPTPTQQNAIRQSCRADFQANCAGVPTGGQAALQCLQQHATSVSQPCQQALAAMGGGAATPKATAPAGAAPGAGGSTPGAQAAPPRGAGAQMSMRDEMAIARDACGQDYRAHCQGVRPGEGRVMACLQANAPALSPGCQQALTAAKQRM